MFVAKTSANICSPAGEAQLFELEHLDVASLGAQVKGESLRSPEPFLCSSVDGSGVELALMLWVPL